MNNARKKRKIWFWRAHHTFTTHWKTLTDDQKRESTAWMQEHEKRCTFEVDRVRGMLIRLSDGQEFKIGPGKAKARVREIVKAYL